MRLIFRFVIFQFLQNILYLRIIFGSERGHRLCYDGAQSSNLDECLCHSGWRFSIKNQDEIVGTKRQEIVSSCNAIPRHDLRY